MNRSIDPGAAPRLSTPRGIGFMALGAVILPFLNASAKYLGTAYPVPQIVWARYAGHLLFCVLLFGPRRGRRLFYTARPGVQIVRSVLLLVSTGIYFTALRYVELPTAAAITFTAPLMVTLLAIPMLGERVGWRRWTAALVGFAGVLVIIRPGLGHTHPAAFLVIASAFGSALYQILTRRVSTWDPPDTTITYTAVVGTAVMTLILPFVWTSPRVILDALLFLGLGVIAGTGHFLIVKAYQHAPASVVAPFNYCQLLTAAVLGWVFFHESPDAWTWVGAAMVVGSGVYTTLRERTLARAARLIRTDGDIQDR